MADMNNMKSCHVIYCCVLLAEKPRSESDVSTHSKSRSSSKEEADEDSESSVKDELSHKMKLNVKKDVLRLVISLSSAVASKTTQQDIIA